MNNVGNQIQGHLSNICNIINHGYVQTIKNINKSPEFSTPHTLYHSEPTLSNETVEISSNTRLNYYCAFLAHNELLKVLGHTAISQESIFHSIPVPQQHMIILIQKEAIEIFNSLHNKFLEEKNRVTDYMILSYAPELYHLNKLKLLDEKRAVEETFRSLSHQAKEVILQRVENITHQAIELHYNYYYRQIAEDTQTLASFKQYVATLITPESDLSRKLTCTKCKEIFDRVYMLQCGHNFCLTCIKSVKNNKPPTSVASCLICHRSILREPNYNLAAQQLVNYYIKGSTPYEKSRYKERIESKLKNEEVKNQRYMSEIEKLKTNNEPFLNITERWSDPSQQEIFLRGCKLYIGKLKRTYCESVGLTDSTINAMNHATLEIALANIGRDMPQYVDYSDDSLHNDYVLAKEVLKNFLKEI